MKLSIVNKHAGDSILQTFDALTQVQKQAFVCNQSWTDAALQIKQGDTVYFNGA